MNSPTATSIAIPVRNEEASIASLLGSLLSAQTTPTEIVIADGGSLDATVATARRFADRGVRVLEIGPAFPGRGRNEAAKAARSDWIAFIDAGCTADPAWLSELVAAARNGPPETRAVFGDYAPRLETEWDVAQALALVQPRGADGCRPWFIASALIHRTAWQAAGGFPEELRAAEDLIFFDRLVAAGVVAVRAPRATIRWSLAPSPAGVFRRLRLYSAYHLAAGLGRTWHRRVFAMDAVFAVLALAGFARPVAWLALVALFAARVVKTIVSRGANAEGRFAFRPDRVLRVAWLLLVADAAAWAGALDYATGRVPPR